MSAHRIINSKGLAIDESLLQRFTSALNGDLIRPGDAAYHTARRVWNGMIDKYPSMIVYCKDEYDVINSVKFARTNDLLVAVRSGGHNVAGNSVCDNGMVIDLSRMKETNIDRTSGTVAAEAGLTLGDLDTATQTHGLAVPVGIVSKTGLAGLTLGGGIGWLMRKYGLTCDNLFSAKIVTADGQILSTNAKENSELFWGIRGGGGNFGVVTEFEFRLHPVDQVIGGMIFYPATAAEGVLRFYRDYIKTIPDDLTTMLAFIPAPPPLLSGPVLKTPLVAVHVCYAGPIDTGEKILAPLRKFGQPLKDMIKIMPYIEMQCMLDAGAPPGLQNYWKSSYLSKIDDNVMKIIIEYFQRVPSPLTQIHIQHMQGAVSRMGEHDTAFSHRNALCVLNIVSKWIDAADSDINIHWTRELSDKLKPYSSGKYINFLGDEGKDAVRAAYSPENYKRLIKLKNKYDPTNFFSMNQNIKPTV
jgi:hypothetical protein